MAFPQQEPFAHTHIDGVPGKHFLFPKAPGSIVFRINAEFLHGIEPDTVIEIFIPSVQTGAILYGFLQNGTQTAVAPGEHGFQPAQIGGMVVVFHNLGAEAALKQLAAAQIFLRGDLLLPLEGCVGLGHEIGRGHMDTKTTLAIGGILIPQIHDLTHQLGNAQNILVRFRRQTQHKVKLHIVPAAGESVGAGAKDLLFRQVLVDHIPQPLGTCLRCEGQAAFADGLELLHQFPGEIVRPERRHGQADAVILAVRDQRICQFLQSPVIGGGKTGKGDLIAAGILHALHRLPVKNFGTLFPDWTAGETGLAEPAATDAAPENFQIGPVMDDLRGRNDHLGGPVGTVQILHDPLSDLLRSAVHRNDGTKAAVFPVFMVVEGRNVYTGDFGHFQQELILAPALGFGFVVERNDLHGNILTLAQGEEIDKLRQRFRIVGADTAGKDDVFQIMAVCALQRHTCQIQHIQDIGIGHLVADGEGDHIEILHRVLALQGPQRKIMLTHGLFHISPRGEDTLTPDTLHLIHDTVQDPHTQIGHTDLIGIRETEGDPDPDILRVFFHFIEFSAGIPGRLLHRGEDPLQQFSHVYTSQHIDKAIVQRFRHLCK